MGAVLNCFLISTVLYIFPVSVIQVPQVKQFSITSFFFIYSVHEQWQRDASVPVELFLSKKLFFFSLLLYRIHASVLVLIIHLFL